MQFVDRFLAFIRENSLFEEVDPILLAVSGGKDSVLMTDLFAEAGLEFAIAHCNFQLRGRSADGDEQFVKELADKYRVPFYSVRFDTDKYAAERHLSTQMAARDLRYDWLESIRHKGGFAFLAVAHHQTDSVETVLLNVLRGTGIAGLAGIQPKRDLVVRPLLAYTGQEVADEVAARNLEFREDASNASTKYKRNKIRLDVLPHLRTLNSELENTFWENSKRFWQVGLFVKQHVKDFRDANFMELGTDTFQIDLVELKKLNPLELWIYELFHPFGFTEPVLTDLISSWNDGTGKQFSSPDYQLLVNRDHLLLYPLQQHEEKDVIVDSLPIQFTWYGGNYRVRSLDRFEVETKEYPVIVDLNRVTMPLSIRSWQEGDKFQPLGMQGKKKVSDFLIDRKVPLSKKREVPLLVDADDQVLAVWPWRIDERVKITAKTKKVIIFEKLKNG